MPRSILRSDRGQALIEFALVLPLLLLLVFGITEFSRAWMTVNVLTSAAREGARLAVVTEPDQDRVIARVNEVCTSSRVTPTAITITGPDPADVERRVTVEVEADFQVLPGEILGTFSGTIPLRARSIMRHESF
jgi:Flp pilus assembly protein TadG